MRLIDADAADVEEISCYYGSQCYTEDVQEWLNEQPTIEATPVVHGRWIPHNKGQNNWCECSECNTVGSPFWKRCPVCEAKMDERSEGE